MLDLNAMEAKYRNRANYEKELEENPDAEMPDDYIPYSDGEEEIDREAPPG